MESWNLSATLLLHCIVNLGNCIDPITGELYTIHDDIAALGLIDQYACSWQLTFNLLTSVEFPRWINVESVAVPL